MSPDSTEDEILESGVIDVHYQIRANRYGFGMQPWVYLVDEQR